MITIDLIFKTMFTVTVGTYPMIASKNVECQRHLESYHVILYKH